MLDECNEAADYNIARHILSIHRLKDEALEPEVSADKLQLYIRYARRLKPQFTSEAANLLVEKYCLLRQNDISGGSSSSSSMVSNSYRMTVRQLESMIRLSEALARLHLDVEIQPRYVREAYRLLKSSLIRVESDSVELSLEALEEDGTAHNIQDADPNLLHGNTQDRPGALPASISSPANSISIKYEDYVRIANMLIYQLRHGESLSDEDSIGMKKSALVDWYLLQMENEMQSESDFDNFKKCVKAVIDRLVHKDCVLIELKVSDSPLDPLLVVHPNYQD